MSNSAFFRFRLACLSSLVSIGFLSLPTADAQTKASCTFKLFLLNSADGAEPRQLLIAGVSVEKVSHLRLVGK